MSNFEIEGTVLKKFIDSESNVVTIPNGITHIGKTAFYSCKLKSVIIPPSVTHIGASAFFTSLKLKNIIIPDLTAQI